MDSEISSGTASSQLRTLKRRVDPSAGFAAWMLRVMICRTSSRSVRRTEVFGRSWASPMPAMPHPEPSSIILRGVREPSSSSSSSLLLLCSSCWRSVSVVVVMAVFRSPTRIDWHSAKHAMEASLIFLKRKSTIIILTIIIRKK